MNILIKRFLIVAIASMLFLPTASLSADTKKTLSVINISNETGSGYAVYWPEGSGQVKLLRSENGAAPVTIAETDLGYYIDVTAKANTNYSYSVSIGGEVLSANSYEEASGQAVISNIKIEKGAANSEEASVIVKFSTDRLAKSQIFYGTSSSYSERTEIDESLNQSHTVLIEKLKPNTLYHFKIKTFDKDNKNAAESNDQTATTAAPPTKENLLSIIVKALTKAFSGFTKWFNS